MNDTSSTPTTRLARLVWPHGGELRRGVDRVEATVVVVAVGLALLLVPVMLVFGSTVHAGVAEDVETQAEDRSAVVATLTEDAKPVSVAAPGDGTGRTSPVAAEWQTSDGVTHTGNVPAPDGLHVGARVEIWLDEDGRVVDAPLTASDAVAAGVFVAVAGWVSTVGVLVLAVLVLHRMLDRRRFRLWQEDWVRVEPEWSDRCR